MRSLSVSEIFGPTIQGEGPSAGQRCGFVRLGLCNLNCSWCDTPYTWDWKGQNGTVYDRESELTRLTVTEIVSAVRRMNVPLVVVSGGEPLVQRIALRDLVEALHELPTVRSIEVETNGTLDPCDLGDWVSWNVSPKLAHSGTKRALALTDYLPAYIGRNNIFKFVVTDDLDLLEVATIVERYNIPRDLVWIMPEGRDLVTLNNRMAELAPEVIALGWNLTGRMQIQAFGDTRGT